MTLRILSVAYPLAAVSPDTVGGAEQILSRLDEALVAAGHHSIVVAAQGSRVRGRLVATPAADGADDRTDWARAHAAHREAIGRVLEREPVDLVHMHGVDFHAYLPPPGVPVLVTLHLPPSWYPPGIFRVGRPDTWLHCVSESQRRACPTSDRLLPTIENGVPVADDGPRIRTRGYVAALGRICPEKGFHHALDAASRARVPLLLAGRVFRYAAHERYFRTQIAPRLDRRRRFLGPVDRRRKRRLLGAARCLLQPSLAPETSSLVAMESLAAGTPVIAFRVGALPEIVEHGVTGFLVDDAEQMADAIEAAAALDPERCRHAARERFGVERMTRRYLERYAQLAGHG